MNEPDLRRRLDSVTEQLLETYEEIEVLTTVAEIAASTSDVAVIGHKVLEEAGHLLQADVAFMIYVDPDLKGEEPDPSGISRDERDALGEVITAWLQVSPRPEVMAPFQQGAHVPHAPDALLAVPLRSEDRVLGAICLGRRGEGSSFTAGDLKFIGVLATSAASVLLQRKNLDLVRVSRDLEERNQALKGILSMSREIASSLDLARLLHAMANLPTMGLGFDRCAVMVEEGGRLRLRGVSGRAKVDRSDPEMRSLERMLGWVASRGTTVLVQKGEEADSEISSDPQEAGPLLVPHMELCEARSFLAIPLRDEQGLLGVISFESGAGDFVNETRSECASILANQATVALRNAMLYSDVPLIGLLGPLRSGWSQVRTLSRRRLGAWLVGAAVLMGVLVLGRWELRVAGDALVLPQKIVKVSTPVRGVIADIGGFSEGDTIPKGAVLARLDVHELVLRHNEAVSREETALRNVSRLEAEGRAADMRLARVEAERWETEREHLASRLGDATLTAPIEGVLLTPRLDERAGELLDTGQVLCTLAQLEPLRIEIAVREKDADVLIGADGMFEAVLKFDAFPEVDYVARIDHVRSAAEIRGGVPMLVAEGEVLIPDGGLGGLRPGMTGQARIDAGSRPLITLLLRKPYRFLRRLVWL